jgi:hypothetical protein
VPEKAAEGHLAFLSSTKQNPFWAHDTLCGPAQYTVHPRPDVLQRDGRPRTAAKCRGYPGVKSCRFDRSGYPPPGRIDRKIRVRRPDKSAAREIYGIYLLDDLPLAEPRQALIDAIVEAHYAHADDNRFLDITFRSGRHDYLYAATWRAARSSLP